MVDDNATNRRILEEMLKSWHMKPTVVASGWEALVEMKRAAKAGSPYQLVLLDCMMPEMDGFMVADRIGQQADFGDPPIIMLTSAARPGDAEKCRQFGMSRYLTKPVMHSEMLDAVAAVCTAEERGTDRRHAAAGRQGCPRPATEDFAGRGRPDQPTRGGWIARTGRP